MTYISLLLIPIIVLFIIIYGLTQKKDIYTSFINGAKSGIKSAISIFPFTISMVFAINIFLHSGILDFFLGWISSLFNNKFPLSILPMALLRPISGSASEVIMTDIFKIHGPDSFVGRLASTMQGSTDTTFYVITLYFGSIGIKKIRYALKAGLFADFIGIISSIIIVYLIFGLRY